MVTIEQLEKLDPDKITYDLPGLLYSLRACELIWRYIEQTGKTKHDLPELALTLQKFRGYCPACEFSKKVDKKVYFYTPNCVCPLESGWRNLGKNCLRRNSIYITNNAKAIADEAWTRANAVEEAIRRGAE